MMKRILSIVMIAFLVFNTALALFPFGSKAATEDKTYTFSELDSPMEYGLTSEVTSDGKLNITFNDQYKSKFFKITCNWPYK